jgi:hypothetical protein
MSGLQNPASIVHVELHPGRFAMHLLKVFMFVKGVLLGGEVNVILIFDQLPTKNFVSSIILTGFSTQKAIRTLCSWK